MLQQKLRLMLPLPLTLLSLFATVPAATSQDQRVEINPFFGYSISDGVTVDPTLVDGVFYDTINVPSGVSYGILFGVYVTENAEVGFLLDRQDSTLEIEGASTRELTNMPVNNYHGIFAYNFGDADAPARPFVLGGLGATSYSPEDVDGRAIDGETQFSWTWGGGVKVYPNPRFGFTAMARWTPTYIKSDPAGVWCGFYGCYVLGDAQYSNQFELSGGLSLRF